MSLTAFQVCEISNSKKSAMVFRPSKKEADKYDLAYWGIVGDLPLENEDERLHPQPKNKRGWVILDAYSASAVMAVHKALNDENKKKLENFKSVVKLVDICFKMINKAG